MSKMSYEYEAEYYRGDKYASYDEAKKSKQVGTWLTTYGYTATADAIENALKLFAFVGNRSAPYLKIIWCIDGVKIEKCRFADSVEVLTEYEEEKKS